MKKSTKSSLWNSATKKVVAVATVIIMIVATFVAYNRNYNHYITTSELKGSDLVFTVRGHELRWKLENGDKVVTGECSVTIKTKGSSDPTEWEIIKYAPFCH